MSDNKILKFPVNKVKKNNDKKPEATKSQQSDLLKKAVPATLFFILCLYAFSNAMIISQPEGRKIASDDFSRDVAWEHRLARQLAEKSIQRGIASVGKTPRLQEELTAGLLHNKYRVQFASGKIVNIELAKTLGNIDPAYVDSNDFLNSYRLLLPVKFDNVEKISAVKEDKKMLETYELRDSKNQLKGQVQFELDLFGRLLAMKVENAS